MERDNKNNQTNQGAEMTIQIPKQTVMKNENFKFMSKNDFKAVLRAEAEERFIKAAKG